MEKLKKFNELVDKTNPDQPLEKDAMGILLSVLMEKTDKFKEIVSKEHEILKLAPQLKVFVMRVEALTSLKLTLGALLMIALHIETFGDAVMYAYFLHRKCKPDETLTADNLSLNIFPWGMLSKKQRREMWDAQKINSDKMKGEKMIAYGFDNLLDYEITWEKKVVEGASNWYK